MTQREVVQNDALSIATQHKRCGLGISMGVGKTRIAIEHLKKNYNPFIKALVVVPKNTVMKSWTTELEKMGNEDLLNHITFTTYLSINKHNPADYDIVYLDECHSLLLTHEPFLSQFTGRILGLTGTPPRRTDSVKGRLVNKYCPIKYTFKVDDATDSHILNDYNIIIHELTLSPLKNVKKKKKDGGIWYQSELADYNWIMTVVDKAQTPKQKQWASIMRMRALMDYETKEKYVRTLIPQIKSKCIIFANTMDQADRVCSHSYHSKNSNSDYNLELFSDGRIDKLSCVLQLSEGVTIPGLKAGIIMHAYGNEKKTAQRIGRLLRLNPTETATCHILCYKGTQDEYWIKNALKDFDPSKIKRYNPQKHG